MSEIEKAREEIIAISKKYDLAIMVHLQDSKCTRSYKSLESTWTCATFDGREMTIDFSDHRIEPTVGALMGFMSCSQNDAQQLNEIIMGISHLGKITYQERIEE